MNDWNRPMDAGGMAVENEGVKAFMLGVYNKLAIGIALAGALAFAAGSIAPLTTLLYATPLRWVIMLAPVALLLFANFGMRRPSPRGTAILYWAVVVAMGLSMGIYFAMAGLGGGANGITHSAIAKAFFITSATFGGLSLFGYTTKRDLGPIAAFAFMAMWGLFLVAIVWMVLPMIFSGIPALQYGSTMDLVLSGGFALVSAVIIAWQTQSLKDGYYQYSNDGAQLAVMTNWGALNFFVSFINLFTFFLRLMADD